MINKMLEGIATVCTETVKIGVAIKQEVLLLGKEFPRAMLDYYPLEGFEKCTKAMIANLKILPHIFAIQGLFDECIKTLEAQKDLYYATQFINSFREFIKVNQQTGAKSIYFPKTNIGGKEEIDKGKIFNAISSFFETTKFLQKQKIFAFASCTKLANRLASKEILGWKFDQIPILQTLSDKPKDFFVCLSSCYEIRKIWCNRSMRPIREKENLLKLISSIGKIALIVLARQHYKKRFFAIIDFATQNASLIAFIYKRHAERMKRFNNPLGTAPAA